jgi:hypothetical protein
MLSAADFSAEASVLRPGISADVPILNDLPVAPASSISFFAASMSTVGSGRSSHACWNTSGA